MRGFDPQDFPDYSTYEKHRNELQRAQRVSKSLFDVWTAFTGWFPKNTGCYCEILSLLNDAVQLGYEQALKMPHKSKDYDIDDVSINGYSDACDFCKHQYFVYGCEEECACKDKGLPCKLEVKATLD